MKTAFSQEPQHSRALETDGPWQEVLEHFFKPFIELCFPLWSPQINWAIPYKVLKGEFPSAEGKQVCDMLFEIEAFDGQQRIIFLHFEIQGQKQEDFAYRMASYNMTIFKKHRKPVVSTAIFLDDDPAWRPNSFEQRHPFTKKLYHQFFFDTLKILDYKIYIIRSLGLGKCSWIVFAQVKTISYTTSIIRYSIFSGYGSVIY